MRKTCTRKYPEFCFKHSNFEISTNKCREVALEYVRLKLRGEVWVENMDLEITDIMTVLGDSIFIRVYIAWSTCLEMVIPKSPQ